MPNSIDSTYLLLQEKIDTARNYYQQLLFRYTKETSSEDQGSRHNATLHKALKTVKDFGEKIRSFEVLNNQTKINVWTLKLYVGPKNLIRCKRKDIYFNFHINCLYYWLTIQ